MEMIDLGRSGARTSRLGFGCAFLEADTAYLLDAAYDAGIRHFDVARSYGRGLNEALLGKFLSRHSDATVTTKFGFKALLSSPWQGRVRDILRPLMRRLRRTHALDGQMAKWEAPARVPFNAAEAKAALDISRRLLRRDRNRSLFCCMRQTPLSLATKHCSTFCAIVSAAA